MFAVWLFRPYMHHNCITALPHSSIPVLICPSLCLNLSVCPLVCSPIPRLALVCPCPSSPSFDHGVVVHPCIHAHTHHLHCCRCHCLHCHTLSCMYTCALGTCMLAFVLVVGTIVALVVMPSWAWFVSVSNT